MPARVDDFDVALDGGGTIPARHFVAADTGTPPTMLVLAHGAGAGQRHPFMVAFAEGFAARGIDAVTFDFPYVEAKRRVPDRAPVLEQAYLALIGAVRDRPGTGARPIFIGGKSMGGRMATHVAARHAPAAGPIAGLVLLGYPLHPPGRPEQLRDAHLPRIAAPLLFVQGERDTFGTPEELRPILARLHAPAELMVVEGGDHSFAVRRASGRTATGVRETLLDRIAAWIAATARGPA
jgi:hypothetical protein